LQRLVSLSKSPVIANGAWGNGTRAKAEQRGFYSAGKTKEGAATANDTGDDVKVGSVSFKRAHLP
jgi:hypothetical protein